MGKYTQVTVSKDDKQYYVEFADELTVAKQVPVSVPAAIKLAVQFYREANTIQI